MCKPNKMGWEHRFKRKDLDFRDRSDKIIKESQE